jgi:hypothetical protein
MNAMSTLFLVSNTFESFGDSSRYFYTSDSEAVAASIGLARQLVQNLGDLDDGMVAIDPKSVFFDVPLDQRELCWWDSLLDEALHHEGRLPLPDVLERLRAGPVQIQRVEIPE